MADSDTLRALAAQHPELLTVECEQCGGTGEVGRAPSIGNHVGFPCQACGGTSREMGSGRRVKTLEELLEELKQYGWIELTHGDPKYALNVQQWEAMSARLGNESEASAATPREAAARLLVEVANRG